MKAKEYHGKRRHPLYGRWHHMIQRCHNPSDNGFHNYGARGITVCDRWRESFANFLADMGECPAGHSIDRIDNDGPYSPENCRWATRSEQNKNRRHEKQYTHDGKTMPLRHWAEASGIDYSTLHKRIAYSGWSFDRAITAPTQTEKRRHP